MNKAQKRQVIESPVSVVAFLLTVPLWYFIAVAFLSF
jgi:hypothetical protein